MTSQDSLEARSSFNMDARPQEASEWTGFNIAGFDEDTVILFFGGATYINLSLDKCRVPKPRSCTQRPSVREATF